MGLQDLINKYDNGGFSKTGWFQLKDDGDTATAVSYTHLPMCEESVTALLFFCP